MAPEFELVNIFVRNTAFCFLKDSKERQMNAEPWGGLAMPNLCTRTATACGKQASQSTVWSM